MIARQSLSCAARARSGRRQAWQRIALVAALALVPGLGAAKDVAQKLFDAALRDHVAQGHVDYPALAKDARLGQYVKALKNADAGADMAPEQRLAFWINAYNALAIQGILNGGSPSSFFGRIGFFSSTTYEVAGESINLYDIEHEKLMPLGEPRIHFAINCASLSCPILRSGSFDAKTLEAELDEAARVFLNDSSKNRFDADAKVAYLSKIFDWYDDDFGASDQAVLAYVAAYLDDATLAAAVRAGGWRIEYLDYDWSLNGTPPPG